MTKKLFQVSALGKRFENQASLQGRSYSSLPKLNESQTTTLVIGRRFSSIV